MTKFIIRMAWMAMPFLSVRATGQTVTLTKKNASLPEIFIDIYNQTGYYFYYDAVAMKKANKIDIDVRNAALGEVLPICFRDQPLTYSLKDKIILVKEKIPLPLKEAGNQGDLTGRVTDEKGEALAGVTVKIKDGASSETDEDGEFKIKGIDLQAIILISHVGYESQEINLAGRSRLLIRMAVSASRLDAVQIIAYGTTTRRLNTGDVSTVTAEEIAKQPVSNPLAALEGRVPGLVVTQTSGIPGTSFDVQIRGRNSIAQGNDPFYVIDGVPYTSNSLINAGQTIITGGSPLNYLNTADIESIEVLKDADALSIYGSRGANGAIIITTKKGKAGQTKVDLNVYQGIADVGKKIHLLDTRQYLDMRYEAFHNDGTDWTSPTVSANDLKVWDTTRYTDWQKLLIGGTGHITNAQASVSGGSPNTQFLFGGTYHRETTVFPGDFSDQKGSFHFNINHSSENQKFKALLTGSYLSDKNSLPRSDLTQTALTLSPNAPMAYSDDGKLNWENNTWQNPFSTIDQTYEGNIDNLSVNSVISYEIIEGLQLKTNLGYTNIQTNEINMVPGSSLNPFAGVTTGSTNFSNSSYKSWIVEPQVEYSSEIGKGKLTALIGTTFQQNLLQGESINGTGYTNDALLRDIKSAVSLSVVNSTYNEYKYQALFGRLNYDWEGKYIVNLTGRRDGSSRFGPGKQFADFGALGIAWIFSETRFLKKGMPFLSFGKLRGSYGTTGNDQIGDYGFFDLWSPTSYTYLNNRGIYPVNLFNPDFAWELNNKLEAAIELGFLKDRIYLSSAYYRNRSGSQLVGYPLPSITGFSTITANLPAVVQNAGLEMELRTINIRSTRLVWSTSFNFTIPKNKLVKYPNFESSPYYQTYQVGMPLNVVPVFTFNGINAQTGVYEFKTSQGSVTSTPDFNTDRQKWVDLTPKFYGGLQNSISFKNFQFDLSIQFFKQKGIDNISIFDAPGRLGNQPREVLNRWQHPGDKSAVQQYTQDFTTAYLSYLYLGYSDKAYIDASFIRVKNLSISYRLPVNLKQKSHAQGMRIYVQGQNLFTITHYSGMDPESGQISLPPLRVLTAGIQFTF